MYIVRKRFMYWYIPATTKLHLNRDRKAHYCFSRARVVKKVEQPGNYILERLISDLVTPVAERCITVVQS